MFTRSIRALAMLATTALIGAASVQAQTRFDFDSTPGRLSKLVVPSRYALQLDVDPARDDFTGSVAIEVTARQAVPQIELHAHELKAASARLVSGTAVRPLQVVPQPERQTWRLVPADGQPIAAGAHRIEIAYAGVVHRFGEGLFRAPYRAGGKEQQMLATQLEAIHARTLFPAFDEPSFRAAFDLSVRAPKQYDVASNMPRRSRRLDGDRAVHAFPATPSMPPYLVALAVGRFDTLQGRAAGIPLRILTAPGKRRQARFAMDATKQLLPYFTQYFGVPYALPKLDQIAVPSTRWGAMEDWGLISYAEDALLVDPKRSGARTYRDVYATVAHEIAHQWFGNLVTAASWEEIWLNEAFATWLQDKATDRFNPQWRVRLQSRIPIDNAMTLDAGPATRAIRSGPVQETAVFDVFDSITYAKGGAVLTMLEQWIGPDAFRRGLAGYMKGQRLSNATAADLWHHIGRASGQDVMAVAASWTDQPGFPLVRVQATCEQGRARATFTQDRFSTSPALSGTGQRWKIPLRYARGAQRGAVLLELPQQTVDLGACSDAPLVVNAGGAGFYRVAYDAPAAQALNRRFAALDEADRVTLLSDTFALVQAGQLPLAAYFDLLAALPSVRDGARTMLWNLAHTQLNFLDTALAGTPGQQPLRASARGLLSPVLAQIGWTPAAGEDGHVSALRGELILQLAKFDDAETIRRAAAAFDDHESGRATLHPSMREQVIVAAGIHADRDRFERLLSRLKQADGEEDRWIYAKALASGRDAGHAQALLAATLAGIAPSNIASTVPGLVARHSPHGELAYRHTLSHFQRYADMAGSWGKADLLPQAAQGFSDAAKADRLLEDQRRHAGIDGAKQAAREAEAIRLRALVKARETTRSE